MVNRKTDRPDSIRTIYVISRNEYEEQAKQQAIACWNHLDRSEPRTRAVAIKFHSPEAQAILDRIFAFNEKLFMDYITRIRRLLQLFSDKELFSGKVEQETKIALGINENPGISGDFLLRRYLFERAGMRKNCLLYDYRGYHPIISRDDLDEGGVTWLIKIPYLED